MSPDSPPTTSKVGLIVDHVLKLLSAHRARHLSLSTTATPPLFIALQGPQGIGKTTLTNALQSSLSQQETSPSRTLYSDSPPIPPDEIEIIPSARPTSLAVLSLDDFYLPHNQLVALLVMLNCKRFALSENFFFS